MATLTHPTLGQLTDISAWKLSKSDLATLLMRADLYKYGHRQDNEQELVRSRLLGALELAEQGDIAAHRAMLTFVRMFVADHVDPENPPDWFGELRDDLLADGYKLAWGRWW